MNDVMLLLDENTPRSVWPLGRVLKVYHNRKDGLVRSAEVQTKLSVLLRPVDREDKQMTKVRIVFDLASEEQEVSLNEMMLPGPKLQRDLFDVLLRFRRSPVALAADLTEMFSQVGMLEEGR